MARASVYAQPYGCQVAILESWNNPRFFLLPEVQYLSWSKDGGEFETASLSRK